MNSTIPVWKFTRTAPARRLYDALATAGLRVSVLDQFRLDLPTAAPEATDGTPSVTLKVHAASERPDEWNVEDPGLAADHRVIGAVVDGELVGSTLLSVEGAVYVEPLDLTVAFDGGYLWGVEVDPAWRRQGIASAMVSTALGALRAVGTTTAYALVAPDNVPSRTLFRGAGFEPERRHVYVDAFGFDYRSSRSYAGEGSPEKR